MRREEQRGFALLVVVILLALMTAATALALDNAVASLKTHAGRRASEVIKSATDFGVAEAIAQLQVDDVEVINDPALYPGVPGGTDSFDIFNAAGGNIRSVPYFPLAGTLVYPPTSAGPSVTAAFQSAGFASFNGIAGDYAVRIGLKPTQVARAPAGEDVRTTYGQVVEVQVAIDAVVAGVPPVQERVSVGVLIPRKVANAK